MRTRNINREILRLAVPNILSNLSVPMIGSVDVILMGQLSAAHIGALGIGTMIFNFLYWNFGFLRMGTTGITAQALGRQDRPEIVLTLARALLVALSVALLILLLQGPIASAAFYLMNVPNNQTSLVAEYFHIRIWAIPATLGIYVLLGWYFGMQNAVYPLLLTLFINLVNMGVSILLVLHYELGVSGVAWGTVCAQYAGFLGGLAIIAWRYRPYLAAFKLTELWEIGAFGRFLRVNGDIFLRTVCLTFAYAFFYSRSAVAGALTLAANTILYQFMIWMSYGIDGFAFAAESLVGKYKGAANEQRLHRVIRRSFLWGGGFALLLAGLYALNGPGILRLFTSEARVVEAARPFLIWVVLLPLLSFASFMWDGVFVGLTASRAMRNSMFLALALFLGIYFLPTGTGNHHLWLAFTIYMTARGLFQGWLFWRKGTALR